MIRIKLADKDRAEYGLPEWIEFDINRPKLSEIRRLKAQVGWEWSQIWDGINADDIDVRLATRAVLVWAAVNRVRPVDWDDFDFDVLGVDYEDVEDPNSPAPQGATS